FTLREIQEVIKDYFKFTITIGIGTVVSSKEAISQSYLHAKDCLNYRLFFGADSIINYNNIQERSRQLSSYPAMIDKKIIESIQFNNTPAIDKQIQQFIAAIQPLSYHQALAYVNQLIVTILKHFDFTIGVMREESKRFYSLV